MSEEFPGNKLSTKKISLGDEGYLERQQERADFSENKVFGSSILYPYRMFARLNDQIVTPAGEIGSKLEYENQLERQSVTLTTAFREFLQGDDVRVVNAASDFIERGLLKSETAMGNTSKFVAPLKIRKETSLPSRAILLKAELKHCIEANQTIPWNIWVPIIQGNETAMQELQQELQEKFLPSLTAEFKSTLPDFLNGYKIPAGATTHLLARLDVLAVDVVDGLLANTEAVGGAYVHRNNQVLISAAYISEEREKNLRWIVNHEFFHALSGHLAYRENFENMMGYSAGRIGLRFTDSLRFQGQGRFMWLNEGVTERLTIELSEKQNHHIEDPSYKDEMKILEFLCTKGKKPIPFQSFVQAYFENYEPQSDKGEQTIPAWRTLREEINRSFDSKFLVSLDKRIKEIGSKKVLEELENGTFK